MSGSTKKDNVGGFYNPFIMKLDTDGTTTHWSKQLNLNGEDISKVAYVSSNGEDLYLGGGINSEAIGGQNIFITKFNSLGVE